MDDEEIDKFLEKYSELFKSLAEDLKCPCCQKIVSPPFYNLGVDFNWAEGCKSCFEKGKQNESV